MKRHAAALIVIAVAAFLNLGLGSRADGWHAPTAEVCKTDLGYVFEWCGSPVNWPCRYLIDDFEACQAGCVMYFCPEQITCTELDPIWCEVPCEDSSGARFWRNMFIADDRCRHLHDDLDGDGDEDLEDRRYWYDCKDTEHKKLCPTHHWWWEEVREEVARQYGIAPGTPSPAQ